MSDARPRRRWGHRSLGVALSLPLSIWVATGLTFHLKPGWAGAYETLSVVSSDRSLPLGDVLAPGAVLDAAGGGHGLGRVELLATVLGPIYRFVPRAEDRSSTLAEARSGVRLSPLSHEHAHALIRDAVSRSRHPERYGDLVAIDADAHSVQARFAGGAIVTLGRADARLSQHGPDTDRIDLLYSLHYGQWTGVEAVDRMLAPLLLGGLALLAILGGSLLGKGGGAIGGPGGLRSAS